MSALDHRQERKRNAARLPRGADRPLLPPPGCAVTAPYTLCGTLLFDDLREAGLVWWSLSWDRRNAGAAVLDANGNDVTAQAREAVAVGTAGEP